MVSQILGIWLAILLLPPDHKFFLALFAFGKILWILRLLQRMPVVQQPIWWDDLTLKRTTASTISNCNTKYKSLILQAFNRWHYFTYSFLAGNVSSQRAPFGRRLAGACPLPDPCCDSHQSVHASAPPDNGTLHYCHGFGIKMHTIYYIIKRFAIQVQRTLTDDHTTPPDCAQLAYTSCTPGVCVTQ